MVRSVPIVLLLAALGCGAGTTSPPPPPSTFEAEPPSVYVGKVKNLLIGQAATDAEVAQVVANPDALSSLIQTWMADPAYARKMQVFFTLAFQQSQITENDLTTLIPPNGLANGVDGPLVVKNATESFARTMVAATASGQPLTTAFSTREVMMTTALLQLYAFLDARRVDDDGTPTDDFALAHKKQTIVLESSEGPIPIAETIDPNSPRFMHWYVPDLADLKYGDKQCDGQDPISFTGNGLELEQMMHGHLPAHLGLDGTTKCGARAGRNDDTQFVASDFTDWRLVTIRPPVGGEPTTTFYDLGSARTATELVVKTPHPGFFSTPAFFANWPTNASNQMRVTLNQALIVATGAAIDGTDETTPTSTPGLDAVHAAPGTSCFQCHQLLDPTRSVLSATYSWFYSPQTDADLMAQPGQFAFQGVIAPMRTIDDFASLLETHPLVPSAWVEKLCYYATSAPCDPTDPEFQRIVADFSKSGLQWNALVAELMASPLVTNAAETRTADSTGETIAVARRDHLCAALNNRLGLADICGLDTTLAKNQEPSTIAQIVAGLPSDGYGRGAPVPVLPTAPTLFYRAGMENICQGVAAYVIDGPLPDQPAARQWSSTAPDAAIADFASIVMAIPSSDDRSAAVVSALHDHYQAALATGVSANEALTSTFVTACLSPSFLGIGM